MKLSVIICTYNREKLLKRALDSVLSQKVGFSMEVIVGNDCSTDGTAALLESYQKKYNNGSLEDGKQLVVNTLDHNSGLGCNWAKGVMLARGEYLAFLDDDDYWTGVNRMQIMVDYMEKHKDVGLLYTNGYRESKDGKKVLIQYPENYPDLHQMWKGKQQCVQMNMVMIRKSLVDECINLNDYVRYRFPIQDWNTQILLLRKAKFAFLEEPSCLWTYTSGSMSHPKSYEYVIEKYERENYMVKYLADCFPDDPLIYYNQKDRDRYVNHILTNLAYQRGDFLKAKEYSKLSGENSFRNKCTRTWITFQLFRIAKLLREKVSVL